jgi:hypothetical protein
MTDNQARVPHGVSFLRMKQIPLTQGKFAIVDDEDFEELSKHKWHTLRDKKGHLSAVRNIRLESEGKRTLIYMHRLITLTPKGLCVDHINGNSLDNRRKNLRVCTSPQNSCNQKKRSNGKVEYKGVSRKNGRDVFVCQIQVGKKKMHIGYFTCKIDAARAYDDAAKIHHGEFARLNFPNP